jgi:A/G-specific adenine glycosylase
MENGTPKRRNRFVEEILDWEAEQYREFAWRRDDITHYEMFLAEFFLSRTRPDVVEPIYETFLEQYPDMEALEAAEVDELAEVIRPLGLQNRRAAALAEIADAVDGSLPDTVDGLLELPRVGPYVANATLCFGRGEPRPIVDRNVKRVYGRVFGDEWPETQSAQYEFAETLLPAGDARMYNLALLDFPSITCTASDPDCESCFANSYCEFYQRQQD